MPDDTEPSPSIRRSVALVSAMVLVAVAAGCVLLVDGVNIDPVPRETRTNFAIEDADADAGALIDAGNR